jgi:cytochrome c biogenesis protein CcmG/thiol:disulfide interchange protein DsbE
MEDPSIEHLPDRTGRELSARRWASRGTAWLGVLVLIAAATYVSTLPPGGTPTASRGPDASSYAMGSAMEGVGIGQSAPDFVGADEAKEPILVDLDGNPIRLDDFAGRPLWVVFWATWCTPCQQEASDIRDLYHTHMDDDLAVLAIDIQEPPAAVRQYALSHDLDYAIGLDPTGAVRGRYGAWGLPSHFFLGANGVIMDRYLGQMTRELMEERLRVIIRS